MRKKFKKRLLGIILTILMVVSVIPVQQVQPVKAAEITKDTWIYLDVSKNTNWTQADAVFGFVSTKNNKNSERVLMEKISGTDIWKGQLQADATNIQFLRLNSKDKNGTPWNTSSGWPALEDGKNMFVLTAPEWNATGTWSTYSEGGDTPKTTGTYYAKASLVDYFNNGRVKEPENTLYNEGNLTGPGKAPYSQLNQWLSGLDGYASNGIKDPENANAPVPLYFGDLLHKDQAGGALNWYWKGANVAFGTNDKDTTNYVAQGIVGKNLDNKGNLVTSYTKDGEQNGEQAKVPFFNESAYPDQEKYMRFYNNLQFPFTKTTNDKGVSTYSFDSEKNTVYYDYNNKRIVRKDDLVIHDATEQKNRGYFPFNSTDPSAKDNLNYGFGTQFTIPFTVTENGKNVDDSDMVFDFTGDDDVWVYIDGALVLDMGGAHNKAVGEINFAKQKATITTGTSDAKRGNNFTAGGRVPAENNGKFTVSFSDIKVMKSDGTFVTLADHMKKSGTVHELKMYYMERGMWSSNMSITYSFVPLPSGLSVSKQVDTTNVNAGLQTAAANKDTFDFIMKKGASEENLTNVSDVNYSFYDGTTTHDKQVVKDGKIALKNKQYANSFENADESDAFKPGDYFNITETANANYTTRWFVTDLDKTAEEQKTPEKSGNDNVAKFKFGQYVNEFSKANYNVNFVNTPKTGTLTLTKNYTGTAPDGAKFGFKVLVDLNGGENYSAYNLAYTSSKQPNVTKTARDGHLELTADETVTFAGIPAGATYQITEDAPAKTDIWEHDETQDNNLEGKITAGGIFEASVTNKTHSEKHDKVIYVEAGKGKYTKYQPTEVKDDYDVKVLSDGLTYDSTNGFNAAKPNEEYTAYYTGKNVNGDVSGKITVYSYAVSDDVYVFDYGLKSDLADTSHGAGMFQNDNLFNKNVPDGTAKFTKLTTDKLTQSTITGPTGTALTQLKDDEENKLPGAKLSEGTVEFNPTAFMDKQETASYETTVLGKDKTKVETAEDGVVMSADVTVMPANVVYYEDDFKAKDGTTKIVYTGKTDPQGTSLTLKQSNGQTEQYGHDDAYTTGTGDSAGSSTKMTADGYNTTASFTFKGTGFDIIARTSDTAGIVCIIEKKNGEKFDLVKTVSVDTYYANGDLYQIPVIHEEGLDYGTYQITLGVKATTKSSVVYLDGVRIYNPMGTTGDSNYIANEKNVTITKIGDLVIGPNADITESCIKNKETGETITSQTIEGAKAALLTYGEKLAFAAMGATRVENNETQGAGITKSLLTYLHAGPNNEMYLDDNAMIAFVANGTPGADSTIQIEAKLSNTDNSGAVAQDASLPLQIWNGEKDDVEEIATVSSSTAMYYKIPVENCINLADNKYLVVILGNIDALDGNVCLSFTNLKYKGYTITNPLEDNEIVGTYIETESATQEKVFVSVDKLNLTRRQWYTANHAVVLSKDVFGTEEPKFTMYYVNANGKKTAISVKTTKDSSVENKYWLTFKAPNAIGNFPVQIRYVVNGVESEEYISTTMNVTR